MACINKIIGKKNLPVSTATVQGHLHKQKQNLQSTKTPSTSNQSDAKYEEEQDIFPPQPQQKKMQSRCIYADQ